ncbi:phosphatidylinositol glycan, class B [Blastomyces dermatitidis ER-3]|uniref:Mannosyltransferase n=1 Tax=Ajellomyces dermatitidis (strain ER-3 / ATCC MYA-2586) TaxID=559297 RepID=A0ABP2ESG9_AJEDR|nr:phosphatidylinositol glycan, class B [Blastomyces dermatitidis ER-3]EEQ85549.2 phosphatidylinositol glycan, class B [Blastomyces dermatitidis ER-3]
MPSTSTRSRKVLLSATDNEHDSGSKTPKSRARASSRRMDSSTPQNILLFLIAFRALNALCVRTFFQPDEFFQSLEPAWQIAFGEDSGAWITWEWRHHLRSSIHPYIFAAVYYISNLISEYLSISPLHRANLLLAAPKLVQALFAAVADFYTWKLAGKVYGNDSYEAWGALALTILSPWQWFCSTRTLSNCLETSLTIVALYLWPWEWPSESSSPQRSGSGNGSLRDNSVTQRLRLCLLLAAFACILRPTNFLVWICVATFAMFKTPTSSRQTRSFSFIRPTMKEFLTFIYEVVFSGSVVLGISTLLDRAYYGSWTFPPFKFLYFNIAQSLAIFYGRNDWHYYLSQGYPLLLTTTLPFSLVGIFQALFTNQKGLTVPQNSIRRQLAAVCTFMPAVLSLISHKEVRFIYPLLPSLIIISSLPLVKFFLPAISSGSPSNRPRRLSLIFLVLVNVYIAYYTTLSHASGILNIMDYFRNQYVRHYLEQVSNKQGSHASVSSSSFSSSLIPTYMTIGFLMPCHSTPWRSHLVFPGIQAWALSCEPPVNLNAREKSTYLDEADQFYEDPSTFLQKNMKGGLRDFPSKPSYQLNKNPLIHHHPTSNPPLDSKNPHHPWPDYLVFFAQLEPTLHTALRSSPYAECYRTWNTAWHDDWRRKGDIVVWCLDRDIQREWREHTRLQNQASWQRSMEEREKQFDKIIDGFRKEAAKGSLWFGTRSGMRGRWGLDSLLPTSWSWPPLRSSSPSSSPSPSSFFPSTWPFSNAPSRSRKWYHVSWSWSWPSLSGLQRNTRRWQLTWSWPWSWRGRRRQTKWPEWMTESPWVPDWDGLVKKSKSRERSERMLWS